MNEHADRVPPEVVRALGDPDRGYEDAADAARGQDPQILVPALLRAMDGADLARRRRLAWVVKQVAADPLEDLLERAADPGEDPQVRRFLLEGIARLGHTGAIARDDVVHLVDVVRSDPAATVREAAVGLAGSLGPDAGQRAALIGFLDDPADEVILVAAAELRGHAVSADELDGALLARLRGHPRAQVRDFVRDMLGES